MTWLESLAAARGALVSGRATVETLLAAAAERNRELDAGPEPVHAFLATRLDDPDGDRAHGAATRAAARDREVSGVPTGPLAGVPVAVKDNICTGRFPTTCGSRILADYRSPYVATAVRRLEAAGARIFGTTNLDEFGMGSSTENSAFGPTRNPIDRSRVPGGSSGGSAAAVASGVVPVALGSSTGGSVRQPAAFCGVVGLKPTYGRVSRYGLVAFASSLDQIGVLARNVRDAAVVLEAISGADPFDATCQDRRIPRAGAGPDHGLRGAVLGVPREYVRHGLPPGVESALERALELASRRGAKVRRVSLPTAAAALPCYYVLATAEASSNLARFDGARYGARAPGESDLTRMYERTRGQGFGAEVKRRIMLGTYALSAGYYEAYYARAQSVREAIAADFRRLFDAGVDAVFAPTAPTPAFRLGEKTSDPYEMYLSDVFTVSANLAGLPALSLPVGEVEGLPVGAQLMCAPWQEERLLGLSAALEAVLGYEHPLGRSRPAGPDA